MSPRSRYKEREDAMIWWIASAHAGPLCTELLSPSADLPSVRAALASGDSPDEACTWRESPSDCSKTAGFLLAVFLPVISWPFSIPMMSSHRESALPVELAVGSGRLDLVRVLLDGGAHRMG